MQHNGIFGKPVMHRNSVVPPGLPREISRPVYSSKLRAIVVQRLHEKSKLDISFFKDIRHPSIAVHYIHIVFRKHKVSFYFYDKEHDGGSPPVKFFRYLKRSK